MREGSFALAMAMFNVVNYLPDLAALLGFMRGVGARLPAGRDFLFEAWDGVRALLDPPRDKEESVETSSHKIDLRLTSQCDRMNLTTTLTYEIKRTAKAGGSVETGVHSMQHKLWPPEVLLDVARMSGFEIVGLHPLLDSSRPATESDWKVMFHCHRR